MNFFHNVKFTILISQFLSYTVVHNLSIQKVNDFPSKKLRFYLVQYYFSKYLVWENVSINRLKILLLMYLKIQSKIRTKTPLIKITFFYRTPRTSFFLYDSPSIKELPDMFYKIKRMHKCCCHRVRDFLNKIDNIF